VMWIVLFQTLMDDSVNMFAIRF